MSYLAEYKVAQVSVDGSNKLFPAGAVAIAVSGVSGGGATLTFDGDSSALVAVADGKEIGFGLDLGQVFTSFVVGGACLITVTYHKSIVIPISD